MLTQASAIAYKVGHYQRLIGKYGHSFQKFGIVRLPQIKTENLFDLNACQHCAKVEVEAFAAWRLQERC